MRTHFTLIMTANIALIAATLLTASNPPQINCDVKPDKSRLMKDVDLLRDEAEFNRLLDETMAQGRTRDALKLIEGRLIVKPDFSRELDASLLCFELGNLKRAKVYSASYFKLLMETNGVEDSGVYSLAVRVLVNSEGPNGKRDWSRISLEGFGSSLDDFLVHMAKSFVASNHLVCASAVTTDLERRKVDAEQICRLRKAIEKARDSQRARFLEAERAKAAPVP